MRRTAVLRGLAKSRKKPSSGFKVQVKPTRSPRCKSAFICTKPTILIVRPGPTRCLSKYPTNEQVALPYRDCEQSEYLAFQRPALRNKRGTTQGRATTAPNRLMAGLQTYLITSY